MINIDRVLIKFVITNWTWQKCALKFQKFSLEQNKNYTTNLFRHFEMNQRKLKLLHNIIIYVMKFEFSMILKLKKQLMHWKRSLLRIKKVRQMLIVFFDIKNVKLTKFQKDRQVNYYKHNKRACWERGRSCKKTDSFCIQTTRQHTMRSQLSIWLQKKSVLDIYHICQLFVIFSIFQN